MDLPARVTAVALREDAVLAGLSDGSVAWLSASCEAVATSSVGEGAITGVAWAPSGDRAVVVDAFGALAVITPEATEARVTLR